MKRRDFIKYSGITIGSGAFALYAFNLLNKKDDAPLFESVFIPAELHSPLLAISRFILPPQTDVETTLKAFKNMDLYCSELSPMQKDELLQVMGLLNSNMLIKSLTSTATDLENQAQVEKMLNTWKNSFDHLVLGADLRLAYKALTELCFLGFYSLKEGQEIAGYRK